MRATKGIRNATVVLGLAGVLAAVALAPMGGLLKRAGSAGPGNPAPSDTAAPLVARAARPGSTVTPKPLTVTGLVPPAPIAGILQDNPPDDAISREFVVYKNSAENDDPTDAIAREFVVFQNSAGSNEITDAIAREFVVFQNSAGSNEITDAIAREFVVNKNSDASGIPTDAIAREFVVSIQDVIAPQVKITAGPREGGQVAPGPVTLQWMGQDNLTPSASLQYQFRLNKSAWSDWALNTQTTTASLPVGGYVFEVRAKDLAGNITDPPASRSFKVDITPPIVTEIGVRDVSWNEATIYWRTNEISKGTVRYGLQATNDFRYDKESIPELRLYHEVRIKGLSSKTPYQYKVDLVDEANNAGTSNTLTFTTALLYDLSVREEDISTSIPFPANNDTITMSAKVRNTGDVELVGHVDFYDHRADTGTVLLGTQTVTLRPYTAATTVTSPPFVVRESVHKPFVAIRVNRDDLPNNNRADRELLVNAQPLRLTFTTPTINTWPSDVQQFTVNVKNTGSQPQALDDVRVQGIGFATRVSPVPTEPLPPGETTQVTFEVNTPGGQGAGNLSGQIVVDGQENYVQPLSLQVFSGPVANLQVRLINERTGEGIPNGIVVVGNDPRVYSTGGGGNLPQPVAVPLGNAVVYGYAQNYMPKSGSVQIVNGVNTLTIALEEGNAYQITQITTTPLTQQQIIDRGVNLQDPQNFWVYDFVLYMEIGSVPIPNVVVPVATGVPTEGGYSSSFGGTRNIEGGTVYIGGSFTPNTATWIVIPGDVRILKQFWDASVTVQNRTTAFPIENASATLSIPSGLGLPALFGAPQPTTKQLGTIPPGGNRQAQWTVRGDFPGTYQLTGQATGNLMLGTVPIPVESTLLSDPLVVAAPSLEITFTTPTAVSQGAPFDIGVHVRNTSSIDLQFVQVNIKDDKLVNCTLSSARTVDLGALAINETKTAIFTFISQVTGVVLNVYSVITPPPLEPPVTVVPGRMDILSVDDSNPSSPKIRFECDDAEAVTARIGGRVYNLGARAEGTHEVTLTNLDTLAPGLFQLEIDGLFQGTHLIDTATLDSRVINGATASGSTSFTTNGTSRSLNYGGFLTVRKWEWSVPGEQYTRIVTGAQVTLSTNLPPANRTSVPTILVQAPAGAIGANFGCAVKPISIRGGSMSWIGLGSNAKIFTQTGAQLSARITGTYAGFPWLFGGSPQFTFPINVP
ncbi:MAG: hypothetical protein K1X67_24885 [Fimbriimonadaceae bacterium]|nr:hypothetical protein [Fimbriimonadaceae bacterium]